MQTLNNNYSLGAVMLKKISIMAFAAITVLAPLTVLADARDDVDDLRADSKRANEWVLVKKDRLKNIPHGQSVNTVAVFAHLKLK